jgi:hypothetical protein
LLAVPAEARPPRLASLEFRKLGSRELMPRKLILRELVQREFGLQQPLP